MPDPDVISVSTLDDVWSHLTGRLQVVAELLIAEAYDRPLALRLDTLPTGLPVPVAPVGKGCAARCGITPVADGSPGSSLDKSAREWVASLLQEKRYPASTAIVCGGTDLELSSFCYRLTLRLIGEYHHAGGLGLLPVRVNAADLALKLTERTDAVSPTLLDACVILIRERLRKHSALAANHDSGLEQLLRRADDDGTVLLIVDGWDSTEASKPLLDVLDNWNHRQRPLLLAARTPTAAGLFAKALRWYLPPVESVRTGRRKWVVAALVVLALVGGLVTLRARDTAPEPATAAAVTAEEPATVRYRGQIVVNIKRSIGGVKKYYSVNEAGVLPVRKDDQFYIECNVDPPAYVYLVWVDPDHDVTLVYPWNPEEKNPVRMHKESRTGDVRLPKEVDGAFTAPEAKPGVATVVLFARPTPLDVPDEEVKKWFRDMPNLPLPRDGEGGVVWFENYRETRDPGFLRTFKVVGADDPFAEWQGQLQKVLGPNASFQKAVSFARTGHK